MAWIYRVGLSQSEVSQAELESLGFKYDFVEVEEALRAHIDETLDKPYKLHTSMREDAPNFFSCSSLVSYLYTFAGVSMPSLSWEKYAFAKSIKKEDLQFGDLIFSHNGHQPNKPVDHVGFYMGGGMVLQAAGYWYKGKVLIEDLDSSPSFAKTIGYGRVADIKEKRFVVQIPYDRIDLQNKDNLIKEIHKIANK